MQKNTWNAFFCSVINTLCTHLIYRVTIFTLDIFFCNEFAYFGYLVMKMPYLYMRPSFKTSFNKEKENIVIFLQYIAQTKLISLIVLT